MLAYQEHIRSNKTEKADSVISRKKETPPNFHDNRQEMVNQLRIKNLAANGKVEEQVSQLFKKEVESNSSVIQRNPRVSLGKRLMSHIFTSSNPFATSVFKTMNAAMWVEGQPLTEDHHKVLEDSLIHNQFGLLDTLKAENPHVMASKGKTPIYLMGKYMVHKPLEWYLNNYE